MTESNTSNAVKGYPNMDFNLKFHVYADAADCINSLGPAAYAPPNSDTVYCNGTFDNILCWPAVPAYTTARLHCPPIQALDTSKYSSRRCGANGYWEGQYGADPSMPNGWTNYKGCYTPEQLKIYNKLFSKENSESLKSIAAACKHLEMIGLTLSLLALLFSIFIFCYFRSLRCHRTRIHRNLFVAISIHITIQLIVNIDELIGQSTGDSMGGATLDKIGRINNTPILCEIVRRVLFEYTKTVMFMWMFVEGMYLHNTLVISVFSGKPNYILYYCLGWGFPALMTLIWAIPTSILDQEKCWYGYTFRPLFWLIEAPRALIILINLGFLLNIIRVLVTKLQDSNSNEALKVRKAVKAAIVLLPLLGANNALAMVEPPLDNAVKFGVFLVVSVFLISFQGFFIALLYCFLNGEVQHTVKRHWIEPIQRDSFTTATHSSTHANSYVRRTISKRWEQYLVQKGIRGRPHASNRRSETTSSTPLHTVPCPEFNGVPIGKIAEKIPVKQEEEVDRRHSHDSGYDQDETLKAESKRLLQQGNEQNSNNSNCKIYDNNGVKSLSTQCSRL